MLPVFNGLLGGPLSAALYCCCDLVPDTSHMSFVLVTALSHPGVVGLNEWWVRLSALGLLD